MVYNTEHEFLHGADLKSNQKVMPPQHQSLSLSPPTFMVLSQGVSPQLLLQSHDCLIAATLHAMVAMHSNPLKP